MTTKYLERRIQEDLVFEALGGLDYENPREYHAPYQILERIGNSLGINSDSIYLILGRLEDRKLVTVTDGLVRLTDQEEEEFFN